MQVAAREGHETPSMSRYYPEDVDMKDWLEAPDEGLTPQRSRRTSGASKVRDVWEDLIAARQEIEERDAEIARLRDSLAANRRLEGRAAKAKEKLEKDLLEKSERLTQLEAEGRSRGRESLETAAVSRLAESLQRDLVASRAQVERLQAEVESKTRLVALSEKLQQDIKESWEQVDHLQLELEHARQQKSLPLPEAVPSEMVSASQVAELEAAARALDLVVRAREARLGELEELAETQASRIKELEARCESSGWAWEEAKKRLASLEKLTGEQAARIAELEALKAGKALEATLTAETSARARQSSKSPGASLRKPGSSVLVAPTTPGAREVGLMECALYRHAHGVREPRTGLSPVGTSVKVAKGKRPHGVSADVAPGARSPPAWTRVPWGEPAVQGAPPPTSLRACRSPGALDKREALPVTLAQQQSFCPGAFHAAITVSPPEPTGTGCSLGGSVMVQAGASATCMAAADCGGSSVSVLAASTPGTPVVVMLGNGAAESRRPAFVASPRLEPRSPSPTGRGMCIRMVTSPAGGSPRVKPAANRGLR